MVSAADATMVWVYEGIYSTWLLRCSVWIHVTRSGLRSWWRLKHGWRVGTLDRGYWCSAVWRYRRVEHRRSIVSWLTLTHIAYGSSSHRIGLRVVRWEWILQRNTILASPHYHPGIVQWVKQTNLDLRLRVIDWGQSCGWLVWPSLETKNSG